MNGEIIAKYELIIYENGVIETKRLDKQTSNDDYSACSSRIRQILLVVKEMQHLLKNNLVLSDIEIYTTSIANIAESLKVEQSTIADKMTRQLGKNAEDIRTLIFDYIRNGSPELKKLLLVKVGKNTKLEDIRAINKTF